MALTPRAASVVAALWLAAPGSAAAQALTVETAITAGASTQSVQAAGAQVRVFGELRHNLRIFLEGAWGDQHGHTSDLLGTSYPYGGRVTAVETYAEVGVPGRRAFQVDVRGGRYRTPFGLHDRGDHAYSGFLRPPLIRYDDYFGLSNTFLEGGVAVRAGVPALHGQFSLGVPQDIGRAVRQSSLEPVLRLEGYHGPVVLGFSYMRSRPYDRRPFVRGNLQFSGVDARYMRAGVELRGEWISGRPFATVRTRGGYLDLRVHRPWLGPATLVARAETLDYDAGRFSRADTRHTGGVRLGLPHALVAQVGLVHQPHGFFGDTRRTAADVSLTWVVRYPR